MPTSVPPKGDKFIRANAHFANLKVYSQDTPDLTVKVSAGGYWIDEKMYVEFPGGNSPILTPPSGSAKWVMICLNDVGTIEVIEGAVAASPTVPALPANRMPLSGILLSATDSVITSDMVFDLRPLWKVGAQVSDVAISDVINLQTTLDGKVSISALSTKADITGTPSSSFTLNSDENGIPTDNVGIIIERGTEANVEIRWNETSNGWEFTNDGTTWVALGDAEISASILNVISTNATDIAINASAIVVLSDSLEAGSASSIAINTAGVINNASAIVVNAAGVTSNASAIVVNAAGVTSNASAIIVNNTGITVNSSNISLLQLDLGVTEGNVLSLQTTVSGIDGNTSAITDLQGEVSGLESDIINNASSIGVISTLVGNINSSSIMLDIDLLQASTLAHHQLLDIANSNIDILSAETSTNASAIGTISVGLAAIDSSVIAATQVQSDNNASAITVIEIQIGALDGSAAAVTQTLASDNASAIGVIETQLISLDASAANALSLVYFARDGSIDATGTFQMANNIIQAPELKDYSESMSTPVSSLGVLNIDLSLGNIVEHNLIENVTTTNFLNPPLSGRAGSFTLIIKRDATAGRTFTYPASVKWGNGLAPALSSAANVINILTFMTTDGGVTWYGFVAGDDMS